VEPLPLPDPPLSDEEITLDQFTESDVDEIVDCCNDPAIAEFTFMPVPYERRHAVEFVTGLERRRRDRSALDFAIRDRGDGRLLGATGMRAFDWLRGTGEIGYWISPGERGRGIAPRAVRLLSGWALENLPLERLFLPLDHRNDASRRVAEKAGFIRTPERRRLHAKGREWRMDVYERPAAA
jgi:RimJ/RimL family protein N-acetyltransferase